MNFNSSFSECVRTRFFSLSVIADIMIMQPICFVNARIISVSHSSCNNSIHCNSHSAVCVRLWLDCRINEVLSNGQTQIHEIHIVAWFTHSFVVFFVVVMRYIALCCPVFASTQFQNSLDQSQVRKGIDFDLFLHYTFLPLSRRLSLVSLTLEVTGNKINRY